MPPQGRGDVPVQPILPLAQASTWASAIRAGSGEERVPSLHFQVGPVTLLPPARFRPVFIWAALVKRERHTLPALSSQLSGSKTNLTHSFLPL